MDPDELLRRIRETVAAMGSDASPEVYIEHANALRDYFTALDEWLSKAGFLPHDWRYATMSAKTLQATLKLTRDRAVRRPEPATDNPFRPGDLADHLSGQLDPVPVESVDGDTIRLRIGDLVTEPVPASDYRRIPVMNTDETRQMLVESIDRMRADRSVPKETP